MEKSAKHVFSAITSYLFVAFGTMIISLSAKGQEFGGNPPSVRWQQVNTNEARVIFPAGLDSIGGEVAAMVHDISRTTGASLGNQMRKINIVLQNQPTYSNGYVALGPFRSEFYMTPRQNSFELGSLPWHKSLALHEYRHVQQFNNFRKGASRIAYYIFGEEGQALANSLSIPDWFWEGDAIHQETILSRQGRGRLPYFFNGYRSLWASGKNYSWMKLRNGSYRDYVPDHYQLGYLLVNYGYSKFGNDAWKNITTDAAAFRGLIYPFQKSFKRHTGQSFRDFRKEAFAFYGANGTIKTPQDSASRLAANEPNRLIDQLYPNWINNDEIVFLESSLSRIPTFYILNVNNGQKRKIAVKGVSASNYFAAGGNKIVYSSFVPDPRWGWRNYESLTILDINSGKEKRITNGERYLSPSISEDGNRIVAVSAPALGANRLHIIDAVSGKFIHELPIRENFVFTYPVFSGRDSIVSAIRDTLGKMALVKFSVYDGGQRPLTPYTYQVIAFPVVKNDTVFFSMQNGESDKLFAAVNGQVLEFVPYISNSATGNYMLSASGQRYAWTSFTAAGFRIFTGSGDFRSSSDSNENPYPMRQPSMLIDLVSHNTTIASETTKYGQGFQLFNFHSWRPYFSDPEYSYSLVSNNILNTFLSEVYITYNRNEQFKETGASIAFAGLYPVISAGGSFTFDRSFTDTSGKTTWNEFSARIGAGIPLQFTSGAYSQSISLGTSFNTKQVFYTGNSKDRFDTKRFNYGEFSFSATNQQIKARQNIYPRIAQSLAIRYRQIINNYTAHQFLMSSGVYLPGLFRNHNLVVQAAYQQRDTLQQYIFPNAFPISRGYPDIDFPRMWKFGANYHFPLLYPDFGFANIAYLLRVRANVFYDFSRVKSLRTGQRFHLDAAGAEIYFDTRWWNQLPVSFGIRYSHLLDADRLGISASQWELVLPVNIFTR